MSYLAYPKYQSTDQNWLPDIPSHWEMVGLTKAIESRVDYRGKTPEKVRAGIFLVTAKNIKNGIVDYSLSQEFVKEEDYPKIMGRGLPEVGDVLFTTEAPLGEVANIVDTNVALAQRIIKLRGIQGKLDNYYLKYWILNFNFQQHLHSYATGSTALGIKGAKFFYLRGVLPPLDEQTQIAKFLDYKTAQIDRLIEKKKALIEKLGEQRIALITHAVTKGLNPNAPMKDSGVEWLGEVPEHWEVRRMKFCVILKNIKIESKETELLYMGLENIESQTGKLIYDFENPTSSDGIGNYFKEGDVLFGKLRPYLAKSYVANSEGFCSTEFLVLEPRDYSPYFLNAICLSDGFIKLVDSSTYGSKMPRASWDFIGNIEVSIPPLDEQYQIIEELDRNIKQLDSMVAITNITINKLNEYRTALITAAVTGKIDVRQFEVPEE